MITPNIKPAPYDWKYVLQAWNDTLGRGGLSIHAIATICKRSAEDILSEIEHDETPGVYLYICGTLWEPKLKQKGLPAFQYSPDTKYLYNLKDAKRALKEYPWPEYKGFLRWKGEKEVTFEDYNGEGKHLTPYKMRIYAQKLARLDNNKIKWGTGEIKKL